MKVEHPACSGGKLVKDFGDAWRVKPKPGVRVGRGNQVCGAGRGGEFDHFEALREGCRAIVKTRQDVAMYINHLSRYAVFGV
jgi:hypothetical protein